MKEFLLSMLSQDGKVRTKSTIATFLTIIFGLSQIVEVFKQGNLSEAFIWADVTLITTVLGLGTVNNIQNKKIEHEKI